MAASPRQERSQADGLLRPFPLDRPLPRGTVTIVVESTGDLQLDALMVQPAVATTVYARGRERAAVLYVNASGRATTTKSLAPGSGGTYAANGTPRGPSRSPLVDITGGGFSITT